MPSGQSLVVVAAPPASRIIGTGEMADLVRAYDWATTPLGSIETWSKELLTIVNLTLCSPSPARTMWGPDFILIYNDAYRPIPGPRHPRALGKPAKTVYREAWHVVGPLLENAFATGHTFFYEKFAVPLETGHGVEDRYLNYSFNPIYEDGRIAGLFGPLHDVTSEVLATRRLSESEKALDAAIGRLNQVLESTSDAILSVDRNWCITYMNEAAKATVYPIRDIVGKGLWESFPAAVYEGSPYLEHYNRAMNEGIAGQFEAHYTGPLNIWMQISVRPSTEGIVLFFRDVTEVRRTEAALLQNEKLAAVGRLASSIAHEINNPLESVMNLIYLARLTSDNPESQRYLDTADQEIRRISIIANQTLRFHKQASHPQAISAGELYDTVFSIYEGKLRNSAIEVVKRLRSGRPTVCFEGDIRQVLNNLIGNAIDAMPRGGQLSVRSREGTHWPTNRQGLFLTVADTGEGMTSQTLQKIFDPFFTTKGIGGTGLGLWVSQEIILRHSGALRVRSSPGKGTTFTLFLPFDIQTNP